MKPDEIEDLRKWAREVALAVDANRGTTVAADARSLEL